MATTTRERREEYSSNVVRTLSPSRPLSPGGNVSDIDTKLDYLLDDLQSTVSRGDSAYSSQRKEPVYGQTSRDMAYLSPTNSTTVVRERSKSPNSTSERMYKTSNYQYSTSPGATSYSSQQNASQLDTLLQDLKHERQTTRERDFSFNNDINLDSHIVEPGSTITKTTKVYSSTGGKPSFQRELVFDSPDSSALRSSGRAGPKSPSYTKTVQTKTVKDVSYDAVAPEVETIRTNTLNRYNYSSDTSRERAVSPYSKTVDSSTLPGDLKSIPLSDDILPVPGTKVTTTVRTYTYEIPADTPTTQTKTLLYKNEQQSTTNTSYPPPRDVPSSVVYKTESYNTVDTTDGYPNYREPSVSPIPPSTTVRTVIHKRDTNETTNSVYPGSPGYPPGTNRRPRESSPPLGPNTTIIYKENVTNTNLNQQYPPPTNWSPGHPAGTNRRPREASPPPGQNTTIIYKENVNNTVNQQYPPPTNWSPGHPPNQYPYPNGEPGSPVRPGQPAHPGSPNQPGPNQTYIYKYESSNTTNTLYGPPGTGRPNNQKPTPIITYPRETLPSRSPQSPRSPGYPNEPNTVTYKYSTHSTTKNTHGSPTEREPLLQPAPFPVDCLDPQSQTDGPPKRLDDLMATLGNGPHQNGNAVEPYIPRREIETGVATGRAVMDAKTPSKNVAGPPVYYPPGHEMFARKEEAGAAYRAGGAWARGAGRYEYESESKSKSKSKSGATMVPVCLPLCCAMPCSIM